MNRLKKMISSNIRRIEQDIKDFNPIYKTSMCKFLLNCKFQKTCLFAHSEEEKRSFIVPSDLKPLDFTWRTKMCMYGNVCINEKCRFAHSIHELRKIPCKFQSFCKKIQDQKCDHVHYFLEPNMMINKHQLANTSFALYWNQKNKSSEKSLYELDEKIQKMEQRMSDVIYDLDKLIQSHDLEMQNYEKINEELDQLAKETENDIKEINTLINDDEDSKMQPKQIKLCVDDSDNNEEEIQSKKYIDDNKSNTKSNWAKLVEKFKKTDTN